MAELTTRERPNQIGLTLRIRHPDIDPQQITTALGMLPLAFWKAGDRRRDSRGQSLEGHYHESYWMGTFAAAGRLPAAVSTPEATLMLAFTQLRRSKDFLARLREEGASVELVLHVLGGGELKLHLDPLLCATLAKIGVTLVLELRAEGEVQARRMAG